MITSLGSPAIENGRVSPVNPEFRASAIVMGRPSSGLSTARRGAGLGAREWPQPAIWAYVMARMHQSVQRLLDAGVFNAAQTAEARSDVVTNARRLAIGDTVDRDARAYRARYQG